MTRHPPQEPVAARPLLSLDLPAGIQPSPALRRLCSRMAQHHGVLLGGGTGAGKTTVARLSGSLLLREYNLIAVHLSLDRYFKPKSERPRIGNQVLLDSPESIHLDWLREDLLALLSGKPVDIPSYFDNLEHPNGVSRRRSGTVLQFEKQTNVLIVDSLFALHPGVLQMVEHDNLLKVFVDAPEDLRIVRRLFREEFHGEAKTLDILRDLPLLTGCERNFVLPHRAAADIIFSNPDISVLAGAKVLLEQAREECVDTTLLQVIDRLSAYICRALQGGAP